MLSPDPQTNLHVEGSLGMFIIFPYVLQVYRKLGVWDVRVGIQMRGTENTALVNRTHWKA